MAGSHAFNTTGRFGLMSGGTNILNSGNLNSSELGNSSRPPNVLSPNGVEECAPSSNLFMRPTSRNEGSEARNQRAITPISMREHETGVSENLMDKTLD